MFGENFLQKIAGRREDAIGLDIGSGSVKMAEVVLRDGKPYLKRMALTEVPDRSVVDGAIEDEDQLADTLQKMAARNGFAGARVAAALGGRNLFIREVNFPRMTEKEMREAIRWDLEKYVPFSPDNLYFDFWIVGSGATEVEVRVLLVAVPKEVVDSVVRLVKKAGQRMAVLPGKNLISCRMYDNYAQAISGFARNIHEYFGGSTLLATVFWLLAGILPLLLPIVHPTKITLMVWGLIAMNRMVVELTTHQQLTGRFLLHPLQMLAMGQILFKRMASVTHKKTVWKDREIPLQRETF